MYAYELRKDFTTSVRVSSVVRDELAKKGLTVQSFLDQKLNEEFGDTFEETKEIKITKYHAKRKTDILD